MSAGKKTAISSILSSSSQMAGATFLSRILGLIREQVLAAIFGASGFTDAFLVAYRIPNLLRDLFAEGAFSSAFVPTFIQARVAGGDAKARKLLWQLFIVLFIITGIISILTIIFTPEIINLFAPTYKNDPHRFMITVTLTRIMAPFLTLISLSALFMGALNSLKVFLIPSLSPAFFNLAAIFSTIGFPALFFKWGWEPIYALGVGVMVGGFLQGVVQLPALFKKNYGPLFFSFKFKELFSEDVKTVFKKLGPGLLGFSASQINLLVTTILASGTVIGAISWLNYAFRLFQFPVGILSVSLGNSHLVHFSESFKKNTTEGREEALSFLQSSYFLSWLLIVPCTVILYMLAPEITKLIFERGKFTASDTLHTTLALKLYVLGLPAYGLYKILVPTFYSLDKQNIPVTVSLFSIAVNILFCLILTPHFGFWILALGTTLSMCLNVLLQSYLLGRFLKLKMNFFISKRVLKILLAGLGMIFGLFELKSLSFLSAFDSSMGLMRIVVNLSFITILSLLAIFLYVSILWILGEGDFFKSFFKKT